ncbi:MAG: WD40/YVTN/BNR-like repeat-containing protein [Actinomycetota bacterium]
MRNPARRVCLCLVAIAIALVDLPPTGTIARGLQPEDVQILDVTGSWCLSCGVEYARASTDNEIFAIGNLGGVNGNCTFKCRVLLHSSDAGKTWEELVGGLNASQVLLDPRWGHFGDQPHRVYLATPNGLEVSVDAGLSFYRIVSTGIADGPWHSAINPGSYYGSSPAVLIEAQAGSYGYDDYPIDQGTTAPISFIGAGVHPQSVEFDPSDGTHVWATSIPVSTSAQSSGFSILLDDCRFMVNDTYTCSTKTLSNPALAPTPIAVENGSSHTHASRNFIHDHTLIAYGLATNGGAFISTDGGQTFNALDLGGYSIYSMDDDGNGNFYAGVYDFSNTLTPTAGMMKSSDGGRSWHLLGPDAPAASEHIAVLPNGNVVATPQYGFNGVLCSSDGGATWAPRCS